MLKKEIKLEFSLFLKYSPGDTNVIYGKEFIKVYGEKEYYSKMKGIKYKTGVLSFMQVKEMNRIYSIREAIGPNKNRAAIIKIVSKKNGDFKTS